MIRATRLICIILPCLIVVGCVENLHKVHEGSLIDDKVLKQRVESALHRAGNEFQDVHVDADRGVVTLGGTVGSADARAQAENIARGVYGVQKMDNQVNLRAP